jgi:hypothetical protein
LLTLLVTRKLGARMDKRLNAISMLFDSLKPTETAYLKVACDGTVSSAGLLVPKSTDFVV